MVGRINSSGSVCWRLESFGCGFEYMELNFLIIHGLDPNLKIFYKNRDIRDYIGIGGS